MEREDTLETLKEALKCPKASQRSAPFWGWNDRLDKEELKRQIREMKEQGMGGFFIHSREGLETTYLSEEWMDCVKTALEQAKKEGMEAWIYDEDKWPSGSAGGLVSKRDPEAFTARAITLEVREAKGCPPQKVGERDQDGAIRAIFQGEVWKRTCRKVKRLERTEKAEKDKHLLIFREEISGNSEWYNGYAPTDNLNPQAVKAFLEETHEKYKEAFFQEFGHTIQGFFTDEPNFCDFYSRFSKGRPWIPWSKGLDRYFQEKKGYEIEEVLPALFFDTEGCEGFRHDYWYVLTKRFSESYMKQLYDWCDTHHLKMTGHVLYENDMGYSVRVSGAAMPHYRYMHAPGVDILGEQTKEYLTVKQCSSVANQFGRDTVVSETYGCTGWDFSFEGQKWLGDWQFALGVNKRCQHLALYSITGCRKRDYPPVFNYQTTWWKDNHILEEYFARLSLCVKAGEVVRDILVLHPISTIWTETASSPAEDFSHLEMNMGWLDEHIVSLNEKGEEYNRLARMLCVNHFDFDFGDEMIMEEEAQVSEKGIQVGQKTYNTWVVPPVKNLFSSTLRFMEGFLQKGGRLFWVSELPAMIDGRPDKRAEGLKVYPGFVQVEEEEALIKALKEMEPPFLQVTTKAGQEAEEILSMVRRQKDGYVIFLANHDRQKSHQVKIRLGAAGKTEALDLLTGAITERAVERKASGMVWIETFAPAESRVFFISTKEEPRTSRQGFSYEHPHRADKVFACLGPAAEFKRDMENVLPLDVCRYRLEDGEWSEEMPLWQAQKEMRRAMGLQQIYYNGAPQRYSWIQKPCQKDQKEFALEFTFYTAEKPKEPINLVVEKPEGLHIFCNGRVCPKKEGFFLDRDFKKFSLEYVKEGENRIQIRGIYKNAMELEDVYLTGAFAVDGNRRIIREPEKLHFGDWRFQGYPYYPGAMTYCFELEKEPEPGKRYVLKMGAFSAVLGHLWVNGEEAGILLEKSSRRIEITSHLRSGKNTIQIQIVGSPRNMFGPFHQTYTECSRISWEDFRTEGEQYTKDYVTVPYGILEQIVIIGS